MSGEVHPRDLRVSHAEREHVGGLLQRAMSQGLITVTEFSERMGAAMAASTRGELNAVLIDLPGFVLNRQSTEVLELRHNVGEIKRAGPWRVPPKIVLGGQLGSALLDFTDALIATPVVTIELSRGLGSTTIIIPEGATVDTDQLSVALGSLKDGSVRRPEPADPHFVLTGKQIMGDVRIRQRRPRNIGPITVRRRPFRVGLRRRSR